MSDERRPLLPSDRLHQIQHATSPTIARARRETKHYLTSKLGHYSVLVLVSLDISAIFADLILQIVTCEGRIPAEDGAQALEALGIVSLVFGKSQYAHLLLA